MMSARALMLWAVEDRPAKNAFRASLFAETDLSSVQESLQSLSGRSSRG